MRILFATFAMLGLMIHSFAQDQRAQEYLQQEEQRKKAATMRKLDSAVFLMDNGQYLQADAKFKDVLANLRSIPSDLTFFFGKNSFYLEQYKQSIDWLMKYIQLKGTSGQYSEQAATILRQAEQGLAKQRVVETQKAEEVLSKNYDLDCGNGAKVTCPVCKGDHVIIKKGPFGDDYRTCPYCDDHGLLSCSEYNKLLKGQLERKN